MKRRVKRVKKASGKLSTSLTNYFFAFLILIVIFIVSALVYKLIMLQIRPVIETPKTEVIKLPPNIETQLRNEESTSLKFRIPILMYHYVEYVQDKKDAIRQSLNINPYTFEQQVKTLSDAGYTFMTAKELGRVLDGKMELPKKPVVLTFDDGHWDLDTVVLPILKKYNAKATAYIISGFIGGSDFLTSAQLEDVISSGLVEIGAHTVHHLSLKGKFLPIVQYEVGQSKSNLEKKYHLSVVSFAYPGGAFDTQAMQVVKNSGFNTAVSTVPGTSQAKENRFFLFRLRPGYRTGASLLEYLNQTNFSNYSKIKN